MEDIKENIANNIVRLRKANNLSQSALAKKLCYTDKAISKWERNESTPDVNAIYTMAKLFNVSVNYFFEDNSQIKTLSSTILQKQNMKRRYAILGLFISTAWLLCIFLFCYPFLTGSDTKYSWLYLIWGIPFSSLLALGFGLLYKLKLFATISGSILLWSLIVATYLTLNAFGHGQMWFIFIIGIPLQVTIVLSHYLRMSSK